MTASSRNADHQGPERAVDDRHSTRWIASAQDAAPELTIDLERPVRANRILLSHVAAHSREHGLFDRATKVEVWVNRDKEPTVVAMSQRDDVKTVVELGRPQSVRRLRVRVVERTTGRTWKGQVGFSEIELAYER